MKKIAYRFWPLCIIVAIWMAFSVPYFVKGLVPFPSTYLATFFPPWNSTYGMPVKNNAMPDTISQIYPWKKLTIDSWKNGEVPLWNPYSFSGTPHAANYQSAVFSPFNLLYFILPFVDAWSVLILLQPLLAGVGMYVFLRGIFSSREASLIASIAFMFSGFMTTWMAYGTLGFAAVFLPWALWAISKCFCDDSPLWRTIVAISVALSFLSGHFQISIYVAATIIAYVIYKMLQTRIYKIGVILLFYVLCGLLIAAPQLLLTTDAYRASVRSESFIHAEIIPWQYIITLMAPDFYGNPVTRNDWFGHYAEWASYIGIVPLVLAFFAISDKRRKDKLFFAILGLVTFALAYPTPLNDLLFRLKIPAISTSAASRIMILFSFSLSTLSAFGLDDLIIAWKEKRQKKILTFLISMMFVIMGIWIFLYFAKPFPLDKLLIAKRNLMLPSGLAGIAGILMLLGMIKKPYVMNIVLVGLIGITSFDMYRYALKWMPFEPKELMYPPEKSLTYLQAHIGHNRVFGNIGNEVGGMFSLPLIEGYDALYQGRYGEFITSSKNGEIKQAGRSVVQFDKAATYKSEILQLLGVRYIYHRVSDGRNVWTFPFWEYLEKGSMKQVYNDEKYWIYEYVDAFPRAYLADQYTVVTDKNAIISTLYSKNFNRRQMLVLEEAPGIEPQQGSGSAQIVAYSANTISIKTQSTSPKLLFLSDTYDPGWKATIDGVSTKIYRADYDFRAVSVPGGDHVVRFSYLPHSFVVGLIMSAIGAILLIVSRFIL